MSDRLFGFTTAILALAFFASAYQLESPFFSDPVGPKTFPYLIASVAFIAAAVLILLPDPSPKWPNLMTLGRLLIAILILGMYAYTLRPLGFLIPTALAAGTLSYQINPKTLVASLTGVLMSVVLFVIFKYFLGLGLYPLPRSFG